MCIYTSTSAARVGRVCALSRDSTCSLAGGTSSLYIASGIVALLAPGDATRTSSNG